jgi:hypothetical protein
LRTEYKGLTASHQSTISAAKRTIAAYEQQMRAEGCPAQNTQTPANQAPRPVPAPEKQLDTSKMSGAADLSIYFDDANGQSLHFSAPADYRWMTVGGMMQATDADVEALAAGGIRVAQLTHMTRWTWFDCPLRTGSGPTQSEFRCNLKMKFYDPTNTKQLTVLAEGLGEASAIVRVYPKQKGNLAIHVASVTLRELADPRFTKTLYHIDYQLHEH